MSATLEQAPTPHFDTLAIHGGHSGDPATHARAVPIYQTTSYLFDSTEHAGKLFALQEFGNIYTRINNPTTDVLEQRLAALEGGAAALAVASGQAAVVYSILNLARSGDHIVSSNSLYGGTYNAFAHTLKRFGVDVTLVDFNDPAAVANAIRPNTKAIFAETLGNPKIDVLDLETYAALAHEHGLPLVVDNTLTDALSPAPDRLRRRHRGALGDQVHRRPRHRDRRRDRRRRKIRLGQQSALRGRLRRARSVVSRACSTRRSSGTSPTS